MRLLLAGGRSSFSPFFWEASVSPGSLKLVAAGGPFSSAALLLVEGRLLWTEVEIEFIARYVRVGEFISEIRNLNDSLFLDKLC